MPEDGVAAIMAGDITGL